MALVKCTECGHDVSSLAAACPNCGAPVERAEKPVDMSRQKSDLIELDYAICPKCGDRNPAGSQFCQQCETPLGRGAGGSDMSEASPAKRGYGPFFAVGIVALIVIGVILFVSYSRQPEPGFVVSFEKTGPSQCKVVFQGIKSGKVYPELNGSGGLCEDLYKGMPIDIAAGGKSISGTVINASLRLVSP